MSKPLGERVRILKEEDWDEIRQHAYAMVSETVRLDMDTAELYAMLAMIEAREAGVVRCLN
jgi:hypothetical protein